MYKVEKQWACLINNIKWLNVLIDFCKERLLKTIGKNSQYQQSDFELCSTIAYFIVY
jgi:hypothetical protein